MRASILTLALLVACGPKAPADNPSGVRCSRGEYFVPGCSEDPGLVAGCYERCAFGATCTPGTTCAPVSVMPACAMAGDDASCDACAEDVELCLPSAE